MGCTQSDDRAAVRPGEVATDSAATTVAGAQKAATAAADAATSARAAAQSWRDGATASLPRARTAGAVADTVSKPTGAIVPSAAAEGVGQQPGGPPPGEAATSDQLSAQKVPVSAAEAAIAAAAERAAKTAASADPRDDRIGTDYTPPPGGREGRPLTGGPPTNLLEVPGTPCDDGLIARPAVTLRSGAVYEGQWKDTQRNGAGVLMWPTGEMYEGQFIADTCEGQGIWKDAKGNNYEGQWKNNKLDGHGTFTFSDGSVYMGEWKDDLKEGPAREVWADGTIYEGQFKQVTCSLYLRVSMTFILRQASG